MPKSIEYVRPTSVAEALEMLGRENTIKHILAGGTTINGKPVHADVIIDLSAMVLDRVAAEGNVLKIGAMTTLQTLVELGANVPPNHPLSILCLAAKDTGALGIRNRATLGGTVASADFVSPMVTTLLACEASVVLHTTKNAKEQKVIALSGFLQYARQILDEGGLIIGVQMPLVGDTILRYEKVARTPADYPIVCAAAQYAYHNGTVRNLKLALGGVSHIPIRLHDMGFEMDSKPLSNLEMTMENALTKIKPDIPNHWLGSSDYRLAMAKVLIRRTVKGEV
jgi:carbon-monoxide dehydrogenase medium subunit